MVIALPVPEGANDLLNRDPFALLVGMVLDQQIPLEKAFTSPYVLAQRLGHPPTVVELAGFDADELVSIFATPPALHRFPKAMFALLVGMVLDQQIPLEKAFTSPYVLAQRLGHPPTVVELAGFDADELVSIFATPPALHRFPKAMAGRVQQVCQTLVEHYDGTAESLWHDATTGAELFNRISSLPGFGKQKSQIFVALLGKQYGVQPTGWRAAAGDYGVDGSFKSVADIVDGESLTKVRAYKKEMKAAAKA